MLVHSNQTLTILTFTLQGLDLAAKPMGKLGGAARAGARSGPIGGGAAAQSLDFGPTTRKRLSRKSPGPELRKPNRSVLPPSNVVGPETVSVPVLVVVRYMHAYLCIPFVYSDLACAPPNHSAGSSTPVIGHLDEPSISMAVQ